MIPKYFKLFVDSVDYIKLFRRIAFIWVLWLTTETVFWAMNLAQNSTDDTAGTALLIGAVLTPVAGVQGWVLKIYNEGSMKQQQINKDVEGV